MRALFTISIYTAVFAFLGVSSLNAQVLYEDSFNNNLTTTSNSAYDVHLEDGNLVITGNGTASSFNAFEYGVHSNGAPSTFNMSAAPRVFIKARGTGSPVLRIDVKDANGFVSNLEANFASLTNGFSIYTLDYTGDFFDGGFGGSPCTSDTAPCPVNPATISNLVFFVNAAEGGYNGTIEIDWISVGQPLEDTLPVNIDARYNQIGYHLTREKLISITATEDFEPIPFTIFNEAGTQVLSGTTSSPQLWSLSNEYVATIDFSSVDIAGTYVVVVNENEIEINILADGYEALSQATLKYYYFNRASTPITSQFGGIHARNAGLPDTEVIVHSSAASGTRPTGTVISAPKGWFDAGDYNKYVVNSGISTYTLLAAFEHFENHLASQSFDIPENTNTLPDVLDEVKWNLDWMLAMQDPEDGGVYHKLTGLNFSGVIMPDQYDLDRYVVQKSTAAALNFAAVTAIASRVYADYEGVLPGFSTQLLAASELAYAWAKGNPTSFYNQPADVQTGEYGDFDVTDEFQWAAVELFITTQNQTYTNDINVASIGNGIPTWQYTAPLALYSIAAHRAALQGTINVDNATNKILTTATAIKDRVNNSIMRIGMTSENFTWGSNGEAGNQIMNLLMAFQITEDETYLEAAFTATDYILGRNATGFSFITGYGDTPTSHPHHRISEADALEDPVPGMVAGGPQSGQQDGCPGYPSNLPATSYIDDWCSYSTNEVTINWNAPFFYSFTALHIYQNEQVLSVSGEEDNLTSEDLIIFPNPPVDQLNLKVRQRGDVLIEIFDLNGRKVLDSTLKDGHRSVDISKLANGLYLLQAQVSGKKLVQKFIKQ